MTWWRRSVFHAVHTPYGYDGSPEEKPDRRT
jgi:hypothetical protein